jgi:Lar family restriction alleviation protein
MSTQGSWTIDNTRGKMMDYNGDAISESEWMAAERQNFEEMMEGSRNEEELPEISDCPFCGNTDAKKKFNLLDGERVGCPVCGASGPGGDTLEEAIKHWNRQDGG